MVAADAEANKSEKRPSPRALARGAVLLGFRRIVFHNRLDVRKSQAVCNGSVECSDQAGNTCASWRNSDIASARQRKNFRKFLARVRRYQVNG